MDTYTKHFCFEFFNIFKYIKITFQIKGAYAPEIKKASLAKKDYLYQDH
jgi:hypothetical protein